MIAVATDIGGKNQWLNTPPIGHERHTWCIASEMPTD